MVSFVFCSFAFKIVNENEMKRKFYIFGVLAALCLLGTSYYAWTLYNAHCKQVAEWNEGAKAAFEEALWMEVNKRAEIPIYQSSGGERGMMILDTKIPDSVSVMTANGWRKYKIDRDKYEKSLIKETRKRVRLSTLFSKYPLSVDTLAAQLDRLISEKNILAKSSIRYIYTDLALREDTVYSNGKRPMYDSDSLNVKFLGFRCEHGITAYISYPHWMSFLTIPQYLIVFLPCLLWLLLFMSYSKIETSLHHKLVREKVIVQEKTIEIEKKVIIEKEIHIADVQIDKANVFKLPDGTLFDSFAKFLSKGEIRHSIQPQSVSLLKLFLSRSDYRVTSTEISMELWKEEREKEKLYSAVRRLRNDLKAVNSELIITCTNGEYELKSPISSENPDQN